MISFKGHTIVEGTALTPAQLDANNSKTGEHRIDILIRLVKDKVPLELAKGGTFTVGDDYIDQVVKDAKESRYIWSWWILSHRPIRKRNKIKQPT